MKLVERRVEKMGGALDGRQAAQDQQAGDHGADAKFLGQGPGLVVVTAWVLPDRRGVHRDLSWRLPAIGWGRLIEADVSESSELLVPLFKARLGG